MMNGEIWWVDFQEPRGSTPAFVRPGIIVQNNELNESDLNSTIVIPITADWPTIKEMYFSINLNQNFQKILWLCVLRLQRLINRHYWKRILNYHQIY